MSLFSYRGDILDTKIDISKLFSRFGIDIRIEGDEDASYNVTEGLINSDYLYLFHKRVILTCPIVDGKINENMCYIEGELKKNVEDCTFSLS